MAENILSTCQTVWGMLCAEGNHKEGTQEHDAKGGKPSWGEWEDLERLEGAQQHMMELWLHTGLLPEHSVEKQKVQTGAMVFFFFVCVKKN